MRFVLSDWSPEATSSLPEPALEQLRIGALVAVLFVAAADGHVENAEMNALTAWLDSAAKRPGPIGALFPDGHRRALTLLSSIIGDKNSLRAQLAASMASLDGAVTPAARKAYTDEVRALALSVAEASRGTGWFSLLNPQISPEERTMLKALDHLLA